MVHIIAAVPLCQTETFWRQLFAFTLRLAYSWNHMIYIYAVVGPLSLESGAEKVYFTKFILPYNFEDVPIIGPYNLDILKHNVAVQTLLLYFRIT